MIYGGLWFLREVEAAGHCFYAVARNSVQPLADSEHAQFSIYFDLLREAICTKEKKEREGSEDFLCILEVFFGGQAF